MKLFMDKYRSGLEMTEEDVKLTSVSSKSNLNVRQKDIVENASFDNIAASPGGALSLLSSVAPPNDLILVTDR